MQRSLNTTIKFRVTPKQYDFTISLNGAPVTEDQTLMGRPFSCVECTFTFTSEKNLRIHYSTIHDKDNNPKPNTTSFLNSEQASQLSMKTTNVKASRVEPVLIPIIVKSDRLAKNPIHCNMCEITFVTNEDLNERDQDDGDKDMATSHGSAASAKNRAPKVIAKDVEDTGCRC